MPYIGGKLSDMVDAFKDVTPHFARELCELGADEMYDRAVRYTPVHTGAVRNAWTRTFVDRHGDAYEARVQNDHWRAHWAEWGVGPHRIRPDEEEAIVTPEGPRAGAMHPGYPGAHMLSRAAHEVEVMYPALAQDTLSAWARAAEANARRKPGIR